MKCTIIVVSVRTKFQSRILSTEELINDFVRINICAPNPSTVRHGKAQGPDFF